MAHAHDTVAQHQCPTCTYGPFTRNHYFTGKLLVERDFTDETHFHMEKLRHHEQQLHGWGVVCGLKVKPHPSETCRDRFVCIESGSAVDCCGHDIIVREEECVDITQLPALKALQTQNDTGTHTLQICIRFRECPTEEIPVLYDDCGCDDTKCAPNRILESYEVDVMIDPKAVVEVTEQDCEEIFWRHLEGCPHCDTPNCIVLATITDYHVGGRIEEANIDNRKGRRLLPSTQVLTEVVECLLEHGTGGSGTQGPPGPAGPKGDPGPGVISADAETIPAGQPADAQFNPVTGNIYFKIPKGDKGDPGAGGGSGLDGVSLQLVACGQPQSAQIIVQPDGKCVLDLIIPSGCVQEELTHICSISWKHGDVLPSTEVRARGLIIAFDRPVQRDDLHRHSLRLLRERQEDDRRVSCWCEVPIEIQKGDLRQRCNAMSRFIANTNPTVNAVHLPLDAAFLPPGEYRVTVHGDLIRDEKGRAIDANHLPPWFNTANYHTGDGVAGGTFESWFTIQEG
jgi:hypothetical protein